MKKETNDKKIIPDEVKDQQNIMSEPEVAYQKKNWELKSFSSFEEMNEATAQTMAQLSGEEHLRNTTELIKRIYSDELKLPMDKKIKFRK